ncbi:MAG TPA: sigma-70 family RNA polymerase sigma factor, partial [Pseudonocardiaceae bacterium]|nr:sigma-70 family RNA polymerase sigma factor [Pseudonocardiaceae bacterium]
MATVPADVEGPSDAELIDSVRSGRIDAYGSLYARHVAAAHNLARQLARSSAEADDLVSEAFAKVLDTLRAGRGPDTSFRAYLLTALRHVAYDKTRRDRRLELTEDIESTATGTAAEKISEPFRDTAVAGLDRSLAAQAFARLPERWQAVLWHTEIEGQAPAEVAPLLGLTANGVSALAYRAREGLRQAYLQVYLAQPAAQSVRCQATVDKLGAWTRSGLSRRETAQVETHLDECDRCRALAAELADVNGALRVFIAPLVLGGAAAAYLAAAKTTAVSTAAAVGSAATTTATTATAAKAGVAAGAAAKGGGAAGAASSLPRQLLSVGGPVAAVAAALALALTAQTSQQVPAAQAAPPPPAHSAPAPQPAAPPPAPHPKPAPKPAAPPPPPARPAAAPASQPGQPSLTAAGPTTTVELQPGGPAADLPITVSNTGSAPSAPVSATLNLPNGVTALGPGQHLSAAPMMLLDAAGTGSGGQVDCPGGTGTVRCDSAGGLAPGQSVVLMFHLVAGPNATGGVITGSVSSGTVLPVRVMVTVHVTPQPAAVAVNAMRLTAVQSNLDPVPWLWWLWPWTRLPALHITATNTGGSSMPITVTVNRPADLLSSDPSAACSEGSTEQCTSTTAIGPGGTFDLQVLLEHPRTHDQVTVTATLGTVSHSVTVDVECPPWPSSILPSPRPLPTPTTTPTTAPSTSSPTSDTPSTTTDPSPWTTTNSPDPSTGPPAVTTTPTTPTTPTTAPPPPPPPAGPPTSVCPTGFGGF